MAEVRTGAVTLKDGPVDLAGPELTVGSTAPEFSLQGGDLSDVTLADTAGKTRIIATVPSLDTPVCADETRKFNEAADGLYALHLQMPDAECSLQEKTATDPAQQGAESRVIPRRTEYIRDLFSISVHRSSTR